MLSIQEFISLAYLQKVQKILFILSEFNTQKTEKLKKELLENEKYPEKMLVKLYKAIYALIETKKKQKREEQNTVRKNIQKAKRDEKPIDIDSLIKKL